MDGSMNQLFDKQDACTERPFIPPVLCGKCFVVVSACRAVVAGEPFQ